LHEGTQITIFIDKNKKKNLKTIEYVKDEGDVIKHPILQNVSSFKGTSVVLDLMEDSVLLGKWKSGKN
jgi:hypothetical protein